MEQTNDQKDSYHQLWGITNALVNLQDDELHNWLVFIVFILLFLSPQLNVGLPP